MKKDDLVYTLLIWALPILLTLLSFIGALAVNALMKMSADLGELKIYVREASAKHDALEDRVEKLEKILYQLE